jgi:rhodanese-related sulfurtransferase
VRPEVRSKPLTTPISQSRITHSSMSVRPQTGARSLEGAFHAPLARLRERVETLDRSAPLIVYCQAGSRFVVAATALRRMGFTRVKNLRGGLNGYANRTSATREVAEIA